MRYYDEKCVDCSNGCCYLARDTYRDGREYEACRCFGYILHPEKGISEERCPKFRTEAQRRAEIEAEERLKKRKKR